MKKPKIGDYVVHKHLGSCIVDTMELYNKDPNKIVVRFHDDIGRRTLRLDECQPACLMCYGTGEKDLGGISIGCDSCKGSGIGDEL